MEISQFDELLKSVKQMKQIRSGELKKYVFYLTESKWNEFNKRLDFSARRIPKLKKLLDYSIEKHDDTYKKLAKEEKEYEEK